MRTGRNLGCFFVDSGFLTEKISEALARQCNIPFIYLNQYNLLAHIIFVDKLDLHAKASNLNMPIGC